MGEKVDAFGSKVKGGIGIKIMSMIKMKTREERVPP